MNLMIKVGFAVLALSLGCTHWDESRKLEKTPSRVEVHATLDGETVVIHKDHPHSTAVVGPGERVEWVCRCDPGLEFTVADLRPMVDLDLLTDLYMKAQEQVATGEGVDGAEDPASLLEKLAPAFFALSPGQGGLTAEPAYGPRPWSLGVGPDEFTSGSGRLVSDPVPQRVGFVLWKFTWRVRRVGVPGSEVEWDPHIATHPGTWDS